MKEFIKALIETWSKCQERNDIKIKDDLLNKQAEIAENIYSRFMNSDKGLLVILKSLTGSGKTEIFTAPFLYQWWSKASEWFVARFFIVEPMHALLTQMSRRMKCYADYVKLGSEFVGEDHGEVARPTYLYTAPITLTTIDSYVYGYLAKRVDAWEKYGGLTGRFTMPVGLQANSLTVLDEAHLIQDDAFLGPRVLSRVISALVKAGAFVILSSATLPTAVLDVIRDSIGPDQEVIEVEIKGSQDRRNVSITNENKALTPDDVKCEGKVLVILNTVERARSMYFKLRDKCSGKKVIILHSLMKKQDRGDVVKELEYAMNSNNDVVLVGTQAVEVGIDYGFNKLYTELSPIDSLIQRIGRVGRRGQESEAHVFLNIEGPWPYDENIIKNTRGVLDELNSALSSIDKVQELIDRVYDEKIVRELSENGDELYLDTLEYMSNLHILSQPPEDEPYLRPSYYVDVYIIPESYIDKESNKEARISDKYKDELSKHRVRFSISSTNTKDTGRTRLINLIETARNNNCEIYIIRAVSDDGVILNSINEKIDLSKYHGYVIACSEDGLNKVYDEAGIKVEELKGAPEQAMTAKTSRKRKRRSE